jgi:hypothetical protein
VASGTVPVGTLVSERSLDREAAGNSADRMALPGAAPDMDDDHADHSHTSPSAAVTLHGRTAQRGPPVPPLSTVGADGELTLTSVFNAIKSPAENSARQEGQGRVFKQRRGRGEGRGLLLLSGVVPPPWGFTGGKSSEKLRSSKATPEYAAHVEMLQESLHARCKDRITWTS